MALLGAVENGIVGEFRKERTVYFKEGKKKTKGKKR